MSCPHPVVYSTALLCESESEALAVCVHTCVRACMPTAAERRGDGMRHCGSSTSGRQVQGGWVGGELLE